jgi:hypothetical protein
MTVAMARYRTSAWYAALWLATLAWPANAQPIVDLELVIAVDSSASIDDHEFTLQMAGIAAAFRDPDAIAAISSVPEARIAVTVMFWAEPGWPVDATPWHVISDAGGAEDFAGMIESGPRRVEGGTGIGSAVFNGVRLIEDNQLSSPRQVIDISGDGRETPMREFYITVDQGRAIAMSRGVTVNGLAMLYDEPDLDAYYRDEVIGGPDAFLMVANRVEDFAAAMRRKLLREIEYQPMISQWIDDSQ